MSYDFDVWFPMFTFFVLILGPVLMVIIFSLTFFSRWLKLKPKSYHAEKHKWVEYLSYIPVIYLAVVIYHIGEYLWGSLPNLYTTLFTDDLPAMVTLILLVGIGQCTYYILFGRISGDKQVIG